MTSSPTSEPAGTEIAEPDLTDSQRRLTFGLVYDVMKVLEAHQFGPFDGRQFVDLQLHLFHFLYGAADDRCYGRSAAWVEPITDPAPSPAVDAAPARDHQRRGAGR